MNNRQPISTFLGIAAAVVLVSSSSAAIINVPGDFRTIQAAIDAAVPGDEILVAPGTYVENLSLLGKPITLRSVAGPAETIIDGNDVRSVIRCESAETRATVIDGFTLTNGHGELNGFLRRRGGGLFIGVSSPTVMNCIMAGNHAGPDQNAGGQGGGLYIDEFSSPLIVSCVITGNTIGSGPSEWGGGVRVLGAGAVNQGLRNLGQFRSRHRQRWWGFWH